jgi:signal peptidase I
VSRRGLIELVATVAGALFFALAIQAFAVKPYRIPSGSMEPTLQVGERIIVNRFSHQLGGDPSVGDVTVFKPPRGADTGSCGVRGEGPFYSGAESRHSCSKPTAGEGGEAFVKRVVGMPGDTIAVRDGHVIRNGDPAREPFASACSGPACDLDPITIPDGHYFLMGDNRGNSDDSRFWGPVPRDQIIGEAIISYWPLGRLGLL